MIELDPSGAVAKLQETSKQDREALKEATNHLKVTSDAVMELTTTFAYDIAEIKERLHALDGQGEVEEDTEEHHEATTPVTQPVATEEKHEEVTQPTVATETPVQPVAEPQPVVTPTVETPTVETPTVETTATPVVPTTTAQGDGHNENDGKIEEHNAETTTSGDNSIG